MANGKNGPTGDQDEIELELDFDGDEEATPNPEETSVWSTEKGVRPATPEEIELFGKGPTAVVMAEAREAVYLRMAPTAARELAATIELQEFITQLQSGEITQEALRIALTKNGLNIMRGTITIGQLLRTILLIHQNLAENTQGAIASVGGKEFLTAEGLQRAARYLLFAATRLKQASGIVSAAQARAAQRPPTEIIQLDETRQLAAAANAERTPKGPNPLVIIEDDAPANQEAILEAMSAETGVATDIVRPSIRKSKLVMAVNEVIEALAKFGVLRPAARAHLAAAELEQGSRALGRRHELIGLEPELAEDPELLAKVKTVLANTPVVLGELALRLEHQIGPQQAALAQPLAKLRGLLDEIPQGELEEARRLMKQFMQLRGESQRVLR